MMKKISAFLMILSTQALLGITPHVYVADQMGTTIQIIDVTENSYQGIFGFDHPHVVKVTPDGRIAVVGELSGTIRFIDTITHTLMPTVLHINDPLAIAISPDNSFFCVVSGDDTMTVVKLSDLSIQAVVTGLNGPQDVKISLDSELAYVTNADTGQVNLYHTDDWTFAGMISGMHKPVGIALTVDGMFAYVTDPSAGSLHQIELTSNTLVGTIYGFNTPQYIGMSPDNHYAYVSDMGNDRVVVLRLGDNKITGSFHVPGARSVAVTPDNEYVFVGSSYGTLYQVRTLDRVVVASFPAGNVGANPSNIAVTVDNPPQISLNGCQKTSASDIYNHLTWQAAPGDVVNYRLYRDVLNRHLVATLSPGTLSFDDHDRVFGQTYWYYLVVEFADGFSATMSSVEILPTRACLEDI